MLNSWAYLSVSAKSTPGICVSSLASNRAFLRSTEPSAFRLNANTNFYFRALWFSGNTDNCKILKTKESNLLWSPSSLSSHSLDLMTVLDSVSFGTSAANKACSPPLVILYIVYYAFPEDFVSEFAPRRENCLGKAASGECVATEFADSSPSPGVATDSKSSPQCYKNGLLCRQLYTRV